MLRGDGKFLFLAFLINIAGVPIQINAQSDPDNLDVKLFRSINNARSQFASGVANVVDYSVYPMAITLPIGLMGYGFLSKEEYEEDSGFLLATSELLSIAIYGSLKPVFKRPRPYMELSNVHVGHLETASKYGFPSGHSSIAMNIATLVSLRYPRPYVYVPLVTWGMLAGYARMYYGLHYPSDVLVGTVIGVGVGLIVFHFQEELLEFKRKILGKRVAFSMLRLDGIYVIVYL